MHTRAHTHRYIHITFLQIPSMSLNSNFYDFRVKLPKSWCIFISNFTQAILNFTELHAGTFGFMQFASIKILFTFLYFFLLLLLFLFFFNTRTKHFISNSWIYHHSYNLIYHFPSFFIILNFIIIKNITWGFTSSPPYINLVLEIRFLPVFKNNLGYFLLISEPLSHVTYSIFINFFITL
jgi:hypothetical protein